MTKDAFYEGLSIAPVTTLKFCTVILTPEWSMSVSAAQQLINLASGAKHFYMGEGCSTRYQHKRIQQVACLCPWIKYSGFRSKMLR